MGANDVPKSVGNDLGETRAARGATRIRAHYEDRPIMSGVSKQQERERAAYRREQDRQMALKPKNWDRLDTLTRDDKIGEQRRIIEAAVDHALSSVVVPVARGSGAYVRGDSFLSKYPGATMTDKWYNAPHNIRRELKLSEDIDVLGDRVVQYVPDPPFMSKALDWLKRQEPGSKLLVSDILERKGLEDLVEGLPRPRERLTALTRIPIKFDETFQAANNVTARGVFQPYVSRFDSPWGIEIPRSITLAIKNNPDLPGTFRHEFQHAMDDIYFGPQIWRAPIGARYVERPSEIHAYADDGMRLFAPEERPGVLLYDALKKKLSTLPETVRALHMSAKGGNVRSDAKGGDASGVPAGSSVPPDYRGPRIIINPSTFRNEKDAACVMWNEAFRIVMEDMGFEPVSEPTDEQRKFFSDTAYADDELQLRRTILARVCTFDTSVKRPTDEQLQEAIEFLENVMEAGYPQGEDEQAMVQRIHDVVSQVPMGQQEEQPPEEQPPEEQPPEEQPPEEQPPEEQADILGGETFDDKVKLAGVRAPGAGRPEDVDAAEEAAHDELLAQREESADDSTRYERLELGSSEAEANNAPAPAAPAPAAPAPAAPAPAAPAPAAPAPAPTEQVFVQLPSLLIADDDPNQSMYREVLNTPLTDAPGAWRGKPYGARKDEPEPPNLRKNRRY